MRVRHLQSHLAEQALVHQGKLASLRGARIGVDAVSWLRSIQALKDPFADALGGIPPGIFGFVDKELESFKKNDITPMFVFQGVAPGPQHSMFLGRMDQQVENAWSHLAKGQKSEAQKCFAVSTSRINGDFVYFIFHHLKSRGYECLQAPYFAGAQLAHFAEQGVVSAVFGPPGLLLYGVPSIIIHVNFSHSLFDWVDLATILAKWEITRDQFVDACMLAGTEYCLTYPYLNLGHFQPAQPGKFNFDAAVYIIRQAPLINWMQTFPTEEMKSDHIDGYSICRVLVQSSPVMHLRDHCVQPLGSAGSPTQVPRDFNVIMGERLPNGLYYLMLMGIISNKLPQALAKGEWTDKSQPLVDTSEFREMLVGLEDYRQKALGLIARHLHHVFQQRRILCKAFWDPQPIRKLLSGSEANLPQGARIITPAIKRGLRWNIRREAVEAEMARQGVTQVDFRFCLNWHANEYNCDGALVKSLMSNGFPNMTMDLNSLTALVHLMVLENLELIMEDGGMTVLGNVLKDTPAQFQEPCLVALELMKFGNLSGEPYEPPSKEKPFPHQIMYPLGDTATAEHKAVLLLCRVMSLVPMKLRNDMWNADVDFDLAAFHSLVRILKRALRQFVEASLCSVLLLDLDRVRLLPPGFMCASPKKENHLQTPAVLPTFMLPRACMGIVVRHFLEYDSDPAAFAKETSLKFPCCYQPIVDLKCAFAFWENVRRCVDALPEDLGVSDLSNEMRRATDILTEKQQKLGIFPWTG